MADVPYWTNYDWKTLLALLGGIGGLASPFLIEWWKHRDKSVEARAKVEESTSERVDRQQRENYDRLLAEVARMRAAAEKALAETDEIYAENVLLREQLRATEDWAHWFRHLAVNLHQKFSVLFGLFEQSTGGLLLNEKAVLQIAEYKKRPLASPPNLPSAREIITITPPEDF